MTAAIAVFVTIAAIGSALDTDTGRMCVGIIKGKIKSKIAKRNKMGL